MDRFSPTGKVSIKLVHPLRGSTFPGRHRSEFWLNGSHPVHPRNFGFNKIFRTEYVPTSIPSCKPDWNFAFQVPAHFDGKSHNHLAYERRGATNGNESAVRRLITTHTFREKKKNNKADSFFQVHFNVYIDVYNRERARARDKKQRRPISS